MIKRTREKKILDTLVHLTTGKMNEQRVDLPILLHLTTGKPCRLN